MRAISVCTILTTLIFGAALADKPVPLISGLEETSEDLVYRYAKRQGWCDPPVLHNTRSGIVILWTYDDQGNCRPVDQIGLDQHQTIGPDTKRETGDDTEHDAAP